ncbi:MAG: DNA/RNA non-specific endonuclease [Ignavibacteriaceae bacterium]|nr:DNA/RNA non-specific endonuclease [Ignavibacteriaceae bacterium]
MKKTSTFFVVLFLIFSFFNSSNATGLLTEDFNYTAGAVLTTATTNWTAHSGTGGIYVSSTGLSYPGLTGSGVGNAVTVNGLTTEDDNRLLSSPVTTGSVYASAMVNVTSVTSTAGDYFFHFGTGTSTFLGKVMVRKNATSGFDFGVAKVANATGVAVWTPSGSPYTLGTTYLVVVKYMYVAGTTNDSCFLYVNPTPGGSEPVPTLKTTDGNTGTDATTITAIYLRQSSSALMPVALVDGIKAGTTWADVTPTSGGVASFTPTSTMTAFSQTSATPSAEQTYSIIGSNLTNNVTVTPPTGYEISKTTGSGFVNSTGNLLFTPSDLTSSKTIYVRLNASGAGTYTGTISHSSNDFSTVTVPVTGTYTVDNGRALTLTALIEALYVAGGTLMTKTPTVAVELHNATSPYALVESQTGTLSTAGVGTFHFMSAVNGTNYYIVVKSINSVETWSAAPHNFTSNALSYDFTTGLSQAYSDGSNPSMALHGSKYCIYSGDLNQDGFVSGDDMTGVDNDNTSFDYHEVNDLNGDGFISGDDMTFIDNNNALFIAKLVPTVSVPVLNASTASLTGFSYTAGSGPSSSQSYNLSGSNLTGAPGNITVTGSTDYEVSNNNSFWGSSTTISFSSATLSSTPVYVRLKSGLSAGSYNSENITNAGGGATTINVSSSGTVIAAPAALVATPTSLSSFTYNVGSGPSSSQSYNLSGSNLTGAPGSITVTGSTDYEVSNNNSTWGSSTTISYSSATLSSTPVYVRLKSGLSAGSYNSENITNAGGGATTINVSCNGTVNVVVSNVNLTMGNPSGATTDINNPHNYLLVHPQFCAAYDKDLGTPIWTSWQLNSTWCNGPAVRQDNFIPDGLVPKAWNSIGGTAYSGSNFSRGHMCPSADRLVTQDDNDSVFYMTNMDPQNQDNNAGAWEGLETYERTLANAGNVLYIISGRYGSGGKVPTQYSDTTTYYTVDGGKVNVPAKLWKVILVLPAGTNDVSRVTTSTRTIAILIDNNSVANTASLWGNYRVSVASIEALTGFNFWSNVSPSILSVIKAGVDTGATN